MKEPTVKSELEKAEYEPLLPVEKTLLVLLALLNRLYPVVNP